MEVHTEEKQRAMRSMEGKEPYARYRKAIMGKVSGLRLDPIRFVPTDFLLEGDPTDPNADPADFIVEIWTEAEHKYFVRKNKALIENGTLMPFEGEEVPIDTTNQISDVEIDEVLNKPFMALKWRLEKFTSSVPVRRILVRAKELDVTTGKFDAIKARLTELEGFEAPPRMPERVEVKL